jgi:hypothetical protein
MNPPSYYAKRLADLNEEYERNIEQEDFSAAATTTNALKSLRNELITPESNKNNEATTKRRFHDAEQRHHEYYISNWHLVFAMAALYLTYFRTSI